MRLCVPSWTPAGTWTSSARSSTVRPEPSQSRQGSSTTCPTPPHAGQACERTNSPNTARAHWARSGPRVRAPPATGRACDGDGKRHLPGHAGCGFRELDLNLRRDVGAARAAWAPAGDEEVVSEEGAEEIGEAAEVEGGRREPSAAKPFVSVAVVELARLRLGKHL